MGPASPGAETTASNGMQPAVPADASLDGDLKERERELILATLAITAGSRKLAAQRLGISPRTLRHKLQQLKAAGIAIGEIRAAG
jgi:two-component system response regulator FlrC